MTAEELAKQIKEIIDVCISDHKQHLEAAERSGDLQFARVLNHGITIYEAIKEDIDRIIEDDNRRSDT